MGVEGDAEGGAQGSGKGGAAVVAVFARERSRDEDDEDEDDEDDEDEEDEDFAAMMASVLVLGEEDEDFAALAQSESSDVHLGEDDEGEDDEEKFNDAGLLRVWQAPPAAGSDEGKAILAAAWRKKYPAAPPYADADGHPQFFSFWRKAGAQLVTMARVVLVSSW
jgi:hypothetical protein